MNVASWHVARYNVCAVRAADRRQLLLVVIVACVAPAQRPAHGRIRHARAYMPQHAARILYRAAHRRTPPCRADDRPRYSNTAASPAALPQTRQPSPSALPFLMPNPRARPCRPIARLPKSGDAAVSAAPRALCVVDRCRQYICCSTAPYLVHFHPSWQARAADDSRGHKCTHDSPMAP